MYRIGDWYKFELNTGIWYTGQILEVDEYNLFIRTIKSEEFILNTKQIRQAKRIQNENWRSNLGLFYVYAGKYN